MSGVGTSQFPVRKEVHGKPMVTNSFRWWLLDTKQVHEGVFSVINDLDKRDSSRVNENLRWARLYGNRDIGGTRPGSIQRPGSRLAELGKPSQLTYNVVRSCIDAATTKIAQNRPKPDFLTEDGDASLFGRAKWLTQYVEGAFYQGHTYQEALKVFRDACVFGTGVMFMYWELDEKGRARLNFERVLPDEILLDEEEGRYGKPGQLHRRKWMLRDRLREMFPDSVREIDQARGDTTLAVGSVSADADMIEVVESWHLPSRAGAKDGRHSICIANHTLFVEPWFDKFFPFSFFSWSDPIVGFWGTGLARELSGIQLELNRLCVNISAAIRLVAQPRVFLEQGSQVVSAHLNPGAGDRVPIVRYVGREPKFQTPVAMNSEVYAEREKWIRLAYEVTGISQLSATGKKPGGIESGEGLRVYNDTASERFITTSQRWEEFFMDLSRKVVAMSRRRFEAGDKKLGVLAQKDRWVKQVKWSEVDLDDDAYRMKVFPTSLLPSTPAGKIETVSELLKSGLLPQKYAASLIDFPDTERFLSLETAALDDILWTIEQILEEGRPGDVDEMTDLELAKKLGMAYLLKSKRQRFPESRVELLRRWVDAVTDKLAEMNAPPAPDDGQTAPQAAAPAPTQPTDIPAPADNGNPISDPLAKVGVTPLDRPGVGGGIELGAGGGITHDDLLAAGSGLGSPQAIQGMVGGGGIVGGLSMGGHRIPGGDAGMNTVSDPKAKDHVRAAKAAPPARMMDAIGGGKTFRYKPGVPGEDPGDQKFGTTTTDLKETPMGRSMVTRDPETGYEAIDIKEAVGPLLASVGNLNERLRKLEGDSANDDKRSAG